MASVNSTASESTTKKNPALKANTSISLRVPTGSIPVPSSTENSAPVAMNPPPSRARTTSRGTVSSATRPRPNTAMPATTREASRYWAPGTPAREEAGSVTAVGPRSRVGGWMPSDIREEHHGAGDDASTAP